MAQLNHDIPRINTIKARIKELNNNLDISDTPGNFGVQFNAKQRIENRVKDFVKSISENRNIRIKLSGDGFLIGRKVNMVSVGFSFVDDVNCQSGRKNYGLSLFLGGEKYPNLKIGLQKVIEQIKELKIVDQLK